MKLTTFYGKCNRDKATCGKNAVNFLAAYILYIKYISTGVLLCAYCRYSGFGGLGVGCWPLVPKFAGSNPAEAVGFLGAKKSSARLPSEGK